MVNNSNLINEFNKACGCMIISKLDVIENIIFEQMLKVCRKHYTSIINKSQFSFNKIQDLYISNEYVSNRTKKKLKYSNMHTINNINNNESEYKTLQFGKYKYKTFNYVYNNDKLYCYNLSFWKKNIKLETKNKHLTEFISYVRNSIEIF